jgi:multisubunit Na+/H+ antiporter MnhE subunit
MAHLVRAASLAAVYLLVLTSVDPADVVTAAALGLGVAWFVRPRVRTRPRDARIGAAARVGAGLRVARATVAEMAVGSWRTALFCLGARAKPGLVEIPRSGRSRLEVALWGTLTGEAPDEVVVDVDEERDVLIVHLVNAEDPERVRERHERARSAQRRVVG